MFFFFADMILWKWYTQIMSLIYLYYIIYYIYYFIYDTCILRGAYHEMYLIVAASWHVNSACVLRGYPGYPVAGSGLFPTVVCFDDLLSMLQLWLFFKGPLGFKFTADVWLYPAVMFLLQSLQ